jgi:uncharacterized membrane protein HdeD (DUF308 family)
MANTSMMMRRVDQIGKHSAWFIALGIAFIFGGFLAIVMPILAGVAIAVAVGWVFLFIGIAQLIHAWQVRSWGGVIWQLIIGLLILAGGLSMLIQPIQALLTLTLVLAVVFIVKGVLQVILALNYRPNAAWSWMLIDGILAIVVGVLILFQWPSSAFWAVGTLAGISFMFTGWSYLMLGVAARHLAEA